MRVTGLFLTLLLLGCHQPKGTELAPYPMPPTYTYPEVDEHHALHAKAPKGYFLPDSSVPPPGPDHAVMILVDEHDRVTEWYKEPLTKVRSTTQP